MDPFFSMTDAFLITPHFFSYFRLIFNFFKHIHSMVFFVSILLSEVLGNIILLFLTSGDITFTLNCFFVVFSI